MSVLSTEPAAPPRLLLTIAEACEALAISRNHLNRLRATGQLPYVKLGEAVRIRVEDLTALIEGSVSS